MRRLVQEVQASDGGLIQVEDDALHVRHGVEVAGEPGPALGFAQPAGLEVLVQVVAGELGEFGGVQLAAAAVLLGGWRGVRLVAAAPPLDPGAGAQGADAQAVALADARGGVAGRVVAAGQRPNVGAAAAAGGAEGLCHARMMRPGRARLSHAPTDGVSTG